MGRGADFPEAQGSLAEMEGAIGGSERGIEEMGEGLVLEEGEAHPVSPALLDGDALSVPGELPLEGGKGEGFGVGIVKALREFGVGVPEDIEEEGIGMIPPRRGDQRFVFGFEVSDDGVKHVLTSPLTPLRNGEGNRLAPFPVREGGWGLGPLLTN